MLTERDLERQLASIDRRGYPAYKQLRGTYEFGGGTLSIDHVQGDPFAAPSRLSVWVPADVAKWPTALVKTPWRRVAFEDFLLRRFAAALGRYSFKAGGSGKSGLMGTTRPGPEVLSRSACEASERGVTLRFEVGFPAHGRTVDARALDQILLDFVPACVNESLIADDAALKRARAAAYLADDQHFVREELSRLDLVAFVADGSVLPRESGVSARPLAGALPFHAPESLAVTLDLPHRGPTRGMGVRRGVTLIVGGGYHGKSTLLRALQEGVYDHRAGNGRELVICDEGAVKLRAEDGRAVSDTDVSLFISNLPSGQDTRHFSTLDASGSTSQAAGTVEAIAAGATTLLVDEDTSATNFMVRDRLMEAVVSRDQEPITPFVERLRDLWEQAGVSSVIVAGSSGSFFSVADCVLQMDHYEAHDLTAHARAVCRELGAPETPRAPGFATPGEGSAREVVVAGGKGGSRGGRGGAHGGHGRGRADAGEDRLRVRHGRDTLQVGAGMADLRLVEQLVDGEQTAAIAQLVRLAAQKGLLAGTRTSAQIARAVLDELDRDGWAALAEHGPAGCGLARPRLAEVCAALNRWRTEA